MDAIIASIITAVITGGITLAGVIFSNNTKQAVLEERIETLTREVRKHNEFAERIPVIQEQIRVANHRIDDLEERSKAG